jgi:subtilase family serine protease
MTVRAARRAVAAAAVAVGAILAMAAGAQAVTLPSLTLPTVLSGVGLPAAQAPQLLGPASPAAPVTVLLNLRPRDEAGLKAFVARVSNPRSRSYGHYLTPAQFRARYAPSPAAVAATERVLRAAGFRVRAVPRNRRYVAATGTVAAAQTLFATTIRDARLGGGLVHALGAAPRVPATLRGIVTSVQGLDTSRPMHPLADPPPAFVNAPPCSAYWGQATATDQPPAYGAAQPYAPCGYTPSQLQGAYGVSSLLAGGIDGRGQTVAIIDAYDSPTIQQDADTYSQRHGLPAANITRVASPIATYTPEVPGTLLDPQGWSGEETLDVEAVHSMAPRAAIVYEGADSALDYSLEAAMNDVVDNDRAQIVSDSYGGAGDFDNSGDWDPIFLQAAAQGIGVYYSSGDEGDETQDPNGPGDREVDTPVNSPYVTGVGGTSLAVTSTDGYGFETGWGTAKSTLTSGTWSPAPPGDWTYGGGGGTSQTYAQPDWQRAVVPGAIASYWAGKPAEADAGDANGDVHVPGRAVPDVSMVGDPNTGMLIGQTQDYSGNPIDLPGDDQHYGEYRIGGTSLSCPLFAGVMALADQAAGRRHGFANPALYALAGSGAFRDVQQPGGPLAVVRDDYANQLDASGGVTTTLRSLNQLLTLHLLPGYDDSTGLGSPVATALAGGLAPKAPRPHGRRRTAAARHRRAPR